MQDKCWDYVTTETKVALCQAATEMIAELMEGCCADVAYEKMICYIKRNASFLREDIKANDQVPYREYIDGYKERISKL